MCQHAQLQYQKSNNAQKEQKNRFEKLKIPFVLQFKHKNIRFLLHLRVYVFGLKHLISIQCAKAKRTFAQD